MAVGLFAKAAISAGNSKTGRKILGITAGCIATLIFISISTLLGMLSIFAGNGRLENNFDAKETQVYQDIRSIYEEYVIGQKEQMKYLEDKYTEENMEYETVTVYNPETGLEEEEEEAFCAVDISILEYQYIRTSYVMAYLSCKHKTEYIKNYGTVEIDEDEVIEFWNQVGGIEVSIDETKDPTEYIIFNSVKSVEEIAEMYFISDFMQKEYIQSVNLISQSIGADFFETAGGMTENRMDIPLYYQYAAEWGTKAYGNGNIARNGCAPTCIAMVFSYLKGRRVQPDDIVQYTGNRYYVNGAGSSWDIYQACSQHWDVECTYIGKSSEQILNCLSEGKPVIMSMGPGIFTSGGHFIVLTGVEDGMVTVNDPNDNDRKNHINRRFSIDQIIREAKGGWSFG